MRKLLAFAVLASLAASARAAEDFPRLGAEVGGRAVYYRPDDGEGTWNPGGQARWHFSRAVAVEGAADYQRHEVPSTTAHTMAAQASLLAYLRAGRLAPFLLAGGGWYLTHVAGPSITRDLSRFGPHVGAGVQLFFDDRWSVDATYRYVWLEDINTRDAATLAGRDFRRSGHMLTLALNFALAGKPQ